MPRSRIRSALLIATTLGLVAGGATAVTPASAAESPSYYLALGDSVAFGYAPPQTTPPADYLKAKNFKGYPEYLSPWFGLTPVNTSCPGETSASFLDPTAQSNGCENSIGSDTGYRDLFPLHTRYRGSQVGYATRFLGEHPDTKLVSINIGANDIFVCQATTSDQCTGSDFPATLKKIGRNLNKILTAVRGTGYRNEIVVLAYYSIDYNDQIQTIGTTLLNNTLRSIAQRHHADVADGFAAFKQASESADGDPCAAGLLIALPAGGCNIHPSPLGHLVLAQEIARTISASGPFGG